MIVKEKKDCQELENRRDLLRDQVLKLLKNERFEKAKERYTEAVKTEETMMEIGCCD